MTPNFGEGTGFEIGNIGGKCLLGARRTVLQKEDELQLPTRSTETDRLQPFIL